MLLLVSHHLFGILTAPLFMGGRGGKELTVHRSGLDGEQSNPSKSGGRDEVGTDGHWESFVTYQVHRLFKWD